MTKPVPMVTMTLGRVILTAYKLDGTREPYWRNAAYFVLAFTRLEAGQWAVYRRKMSYALGSALVGLPAEDPRIMALITGPCEGYSVSWAPDPWSGTPEAPAHASIPQPAPAPRPAQAFYEALIDETAEAEAQAGGILAAGAIVNAHPDRQPDPRAWPPAPEVYAAVPADSAWQPEEQRA